MWSELQNSIPTVLASRAFNNLSRRTRLLPPTLIRRRQLKLLVVPPPHNQLRRVLPRPPRAYSLCIPAPRRRRRPSSGRLALSATHGMINRVLSDATRNGPPANPCGRTRLTKLPILMLVIRKLSNGRITHLRDLTDLGRRHLQQRELLVL